MKRNTLILLSSLAAIACGSVFLLFGRNSLPSKANESSNQSLSAGTLKKEPPFTDFKCVASSDPSSIKEAYILREQHKVNPKGVAYRDLLVVLKHVVSYQTFYALQAIDYRKGKCDAYYTTIGDEEESNPLNRVFTPEQSLEIQLIWDRWRVKNIPGWNSKMQKYLNSSRVQLAKEEYLSLKQLGFRMPKKWEEVK